MPKIVDHETRRREILAATWSVIEQVGLDGVTTRRIAEQAGYSNGVLAHYFTDKDDILVSALRLAHSHVRERTDSIVVEHSGAAALRAVIEEALPLDVPRMLEARIEVSYLGRALSSLKLREVHQQELTHFRTCLTALVQDAREAGDITTNRTDEDVVGEILILIDALSMQALLSPDRITPATQLARLDQLLARLDSSIEAARPPVRARR